MNIGVLGGTFDPLHEGHIGLARAAASHMQLSRVLLVSTGDPPHKTAQATPQERLRMAELGAALLPGAQACSLEMDRPGISYTLHTLQELKKIYPDHGLIFIIGADTALELHSWHRISEVCSLCHFAVCGRPGSSLDSAKAALERLHAQSGAQFTLLPYQGPDVSSTRARAMVAEGQSVKGIIPSDVEHYIWMRGLYRAQAGRDFIVEWLCERLAKKRFKHTLGVEAVCRQLALIHGEDAEQAALAGLLHDMSKSRGADYLLLANEYGIVADEWETRTPELLHGKTSAAMARAIFAVRNEVVLDAIAKHVGGDVNQSRLGMILRLADMTEPNREFAGEVAELRRLCKKSIEQACLYMTRNNLVFLLNRQLPIHPRSILMYNEMLNITSNKEECK